MSDATTEKRLFQYLRSESGITVILGILFSVGFVGHALPATRPLMLILSPGFLFLCGGLAIYPVLRNSRPVEWIWLSATFLITFFLEALGTATGLVFGAYDYGATLGFSILKVPVVIAFNWIIVIRAAVSVSGRVLRNPLLSALLAGGLAVFFDFVMEPVAMVLDYWNWDGGIIPLQNYLAWFLIATVSALAFNLLKLPPKAIRVRNYVAIQLLFFMGLRIVLV